MWLHTCRKAAPHLATELRQHFATVGYSKEVQTSKSRRHQNQIKIDMGHFATERPANKAQLKIFIYVFFQIEKQKTAATIFY